MTALIVITAAMLAVAAFAAVGHLHRIADAMEAQNRFYGISSDEPSASTLEEGA